MPELPIENSSASYEDVSLENDVLYGIWRKVYSSIFDASGSNFEALVKSYLFALSYQTITHESDITDNFSITNANEEFVLVMEKLLSIPIDTSLSIKVRRANILIRTNGYPATVNNIKSVLNSVVPSDSYELTELYKTSAFYNDAFSYLVKFIVDSESPEFTEIQESASSVVGLLNQIQPAHATLLVEFSPKIEDACVLSEEVPEYAIHEEMYWGVDENDPSATEWVSGDDPMEGSVWSA